MTWSIMMPLASPWCRSATVDRRVRARMHGAQVLLECDCAHQRTHQHVGARVEVVAVLDGPRERARGDAHAFQRNAIADGVVRRRQVRLDIVRQRIHAGRAR